jgi:hypothetical protein
MDKIKITLDLTDQEAGYLLASVIEFHHGLRQAASQYPSPEGILEKIKAVKKIWNDIEKQARIL